MPDGRGALLDGANGSPSRPTPIGNQTVCRRCGACLRRIDGRSVYSDRITTACATAPCSLTSCTGPSLCTHRAHNSQTTTTTTIATTCGVPAGSGACVFFEAC
jgi:hypothetical protein